MVKRKVALLAAGLILAVSGVAAAASSVGEYKGYPIVNVVVNGIAVHGEVPGINMEGTTLVPLRVVSEALGAKVGWDQTTSTASVASAAVPPGSSPESKPDPAEERKRQLEQAVRDLYKRLDDYVAHLPNVREKIRIAKEFYEIKKSDQYFKMMSEHYWKTFEESYTALLNDFSSADMNEAKQKGLFKTNFMEALETAHNSMSYYKYAVEHYMRSLSMGQTQFLEFYISSYASAFEEELKAREQIEAAFESFGRSNP